MSDQLLKIVSLTSIEYVEEILSVRNSTLRHFCWKVLHQLLVAFHHRPQIDDCEFVVERNTNSFDFTQSKEFLLVDQDLFEEIFIEHVLGRQIKLN